MPDAKKLGTSLAFARFKRRLSEEVQSYWHVAASQEYAERWWRSLPTPWPKYLTDHSEDDRLPFKRIRIAPDAFMSDSKRVLASVCENTLLSIVTTYESYLLDMLTRIIYLKPGFLNNSDLQFRASQLATATNDDFRGWLAREAADKVLRNNTHSKMMGKISQFIKYDLKHMGSEIEDWGRFTYVRNCIAHTARMVSQDLVEAWPDRYSRAGKPLLLTDKDVVRTASLAHNLALTIDEQVVANVIKDSDAILLARELFVGGHMQDAGSISAKVHSILAHRLKKRIIEKVLGDQRRTEAPVLGFPFSDDILMQ